MSKEHDLDKIRQHVKQRVQTNAWDNRIKMHRDSEWKEEFATQVFNQIQDILNTSPQISALLRVFEKSAARLYCRTHKMPTKTVTILCVDDLAYEPSLAMRDHNWLWHAEMRCRYLMTDVPLATFLKRLHNGMLAACNVMEAQNVQKELERQEAKKKAILAQQKAKELAEMEEAVYEDVIRRNDNSTSSIRWQIRRDFLADVQRN
jgi:hypothetical protein